MNQSFDVYKIFAYLVSRSFFKVLKPFHRVGCKISLPSKLFQIGSDVQNILVWVDFNHTKDSRRSNYLQEFSMVFLKREKLMFQTVSVVIKKFKEMVRLNYLNIFVHSRVAALRYSSKLSYLVDIYYVLNLYQRIVAWYVPDILNPPNQSKLMGRKVVNPLNRCTVASQTPAQMQV